MAEGLLRHYANDRFDIFSAGTHPSHVHPTSIKVMNEWGIDISHHTSDHVDDYLHKGIHIVITVCDYAKEICPTFPGPIEQVHWSIPDPFMGWIEDDRHLDRYRGARNLIRNHMEEFLRDH